MEKLFVISKSAQRLVNSAVFGFWILLPTFLIVFLRNLITMIAREVQLEDGIIPLLFSGIGVYASVAGPPSLINQYSRIRTSKEGIYVRVFAFRFIWKYIAWKDILALKISPRLDRWGKSQWLLKVRYLTYWHKIIGWLYESSMEPIIIINSDLNDREKLLKIIDSNIDPKKHSYQ